MHAAMIRRQTKILLTELSAPLKIVLKPKFGPGPARNFGPKITQRKFRQVYSPNLSPSDTTPPTNSASILSRSPSVAGRSLLAPASSRPSPRHPLLRRFHGLESVSRCPQPETLAALDSACPLLRRIPACPLRQRRISHPNDHSSPQTRRASRGRVRGSTSGGWPAGSTKAARRWLSATSATAAGGRGAGAGTKAGRRRGCRSHARSSSPSCCRPPRSQPAGDCHTSTTSCPSVRSLSSSIYSCKILFIFPC
jgi:hypothetical protein